MTSRRLQVVGLEGIGEVDAATNLVTLLAPFLKQVRWPDGTAGTREGDIVVVTSKIVSKAEVGDIRSKKTLEKIGDYLGIGIANVIMGIGIPRVIISGRLVYGWKFIEEPLNAAIRRSIVGRIDGWSVEAGEPVGSAIGGALEVAVEEYLSTL